MIIMMMADTIYQAWTIAHFPIWFMRMQNICFDLFAFCKVGLWFESNFGAQVLRTLRALTHSRDGIYSINIARHSICFSVMGSHICRHTQRDKHWHMFHIFKRKKILIYDFLMFLSLLLPFMFMYRLVDAVPRTEQSSRWEIVFSYRNSGLSHTHAKKYRWVDIVVVF